MSEDDTKPSTPMRRRKAKTNISDADLAVADAAIEASEKRAQARFGSSPVADKDADLVSRKAVLDILQAKIRYCRNGDQLNIGDMHELRKAVEAL